MKHSAFGYNIPANTDYINSGCDIKKYILEALVSNQNQAETRG